jgi:hypothetical protein
MAGASMIGPIGILRYAMGELVWMTANSIFTCCARRENGQSFPRAFESFTSALNFENSDQTLAASR